MKVVTQSPANLGRIAKPADEIDLTSRITKQLGRIPGLKAARQRVVRMGPRGAMLQSRDRRTGTCEINRAYLESLNAN